MRIFFYSAIVTLFLLPFGLSYAVQGNSSGGGAQGILDNEGNFYFLDILNPEELKILNPVSANSKDIISDIQCTNEQFRELKEYEFNRNPNYEDIYPEEGKFESELTEARKLLSVADHNLFSDTQVSCPTDMFTWEPVLTEFLTSMTFRSSAFRLPQLSDASQISQQFQYQIAYFYQGITYFQQQAMLRLKKQARGVFIKETLRNINMFYNLELKNSDLEKATYYIYHGKIENFKSSELVKRLSLILPKCVSYSASPGLSKATSLAILPEWLEYLERSQLEKAYVYRSPQGKVWSTTTGKLLDYKDCHK
jgi:hypothetical protein